MEYKRPAGVSLVCVSVTLLNGIFANDFAIKTFEYGNTFDSVDYGRPI